MIFVVQLLIHGGAVCCGGGARIPLRHQKALLHDALNSGGKKPDRSAGRFNHAPRAEYIALRESLIEVSGHGSKQPDRDDTCSHPTCGFGS
jgi:hypothetical protein